MAERETERRLAAVVLGDVVGYSRLMGLDEVGTMAALKGHQQQLVVPALASFRARLVDSAGDAMLMEFGSAVSAVACAAAIQRGMLARNADVAPETQLRFRFGINLGDIVVDGDKIFGDGINVAARLESLCEPGGLCLSRSIYEQVRNRLPYPFDDDGEHSLKNIAHPVQVYRLSAAFVATLPEPSLPAPGSPAPPPTEVVLKPGSVLNDTYKIDAAIGVGGMGEIFRGHEIHSDGKVAIKTIRPEMTDTDVAFRLFQKEALVLKDITHDAVVRYYAFSLDPILRRHYLAMEFVDGSPLPELLKRGPLPFEAVAALRKRIASGLHVVHERGIVHRDVSSDNIIVPQGDVRRAKIIDFGIARAADIGGATIIGDSFAGKFRYASPEQLGMMGGDVTRLSDIYSFGLVLAEAATGTPLDMGGSQAEVIEKRRAVPDLAALDPRLQPLVGAMLDPDPARRPPTMQDVADWPLEPDLTAGTVTGAGSPQPVPTPTLTGFRDVVPGPPPLPLRSDPPRRPIERWILGGAIGLVVIGAVAVGGYEWSLQQQRQRPAPSSIPTETPPGGGDKGPASTPGANTDQGQGADTGGISPTDTHQTQQQTTQDTPPPKTPETGPAATTRVADYVRTYQGGACFLAVPVKVTDASAAIDSFASDKEAFPTFEAAFKQTLGFAPAVVGNRIWSKQCPVLDFLRRTDDGAADPSLFLVNKQAAVGQVLAGQVRSDAKALAVLLVQEDGVVIDQSKALKRDGDAQTFDIPLTHASKAGASPQMLVAVTSAAPLASLNDPAPLTADRLFPKLLEEARARGNTLGAAAQLVLVKP